MDATLGEACYLAPTERPRQVEELDGGDEALLRVARRSGCSAVEDDW
jgi:hypothetical protein